MSTVTHTAVRADSVLGIGNADTGQVPIPSTIPGGSILGISGNSFYNVTPLNPIAPGAATFDSGDSDVRIGLTVVFGQPDILFRQADYDNMWGLLTAGGLVRFATKVAGVITDNVSGAIAYSMVAGDRLEVMCVGNTLSAYINGILRISLVSSLMATNTRHGIECMGYARAASFSSVPVATAAPWSTDDLVARCQRHARRPATDAAMTTANWCAFLTEAQGEVYPDLFSRYPELQYGNPTQLVTSDGGYTYVFGADARPSGHTEIYPTRSAIPDSPLIPGVDFMQEGSLIRMLGHRTRTFGDDGPWARTIIRADDATILASGTDPMLVPKHARMLLVWKALENWAGRPGSGADSTYYQMRYARALNTILMELATAYNSRGSGGNQERWWTLGDLGANGLVT